MACRAGCLGSGAGEAWIQILGLGVIRDEGA